MSFAVGLSHGNCPTDSCPCKFTTISSTVWTAAEQGDLDGIKSKVLKNTNCVNKMDNYGYTPLHYAAQHNHIHTVEFLLSHGAMPDQHCCGATPLHRAAFAGCVDSCRLLLRAGANVNAQDYSFGDLNSPLQKAILQRHSQVVELLVSWPRVDLQQQNAAGQSATDLMELSIQNQPETMSSAVGRTLQSDLSNHNSAPGTSADAVLNTVLATPNDNTDVQSVDNDSSSAVVCHLCGQPSLSFSRTKSNRLLCQTCRYSSNRPFAIFK